MLTAAFLCWIPFLSPDREHQSTKGRYAGIAASGQTLLTNDRMW